MASTDIERLLKSRNEAMVDVYVKGDVEKIMGFFSKDVAFTDIALQATFNHTTLRAFYEKMYTQLSEISMARSVMSGSSETVAWEVELEFLNLADMPEMALKSGQRVRVQGVSVQHWREEEGVGEKSWKIWKQSDYFISVKK